MKLLAAVLVWAFAPIVVEAKSVFAHFMVNNTDAFKVDDWRTQMSLAQAAHIDAFALNMAYNDSVLHNQIPNAFAAAESLGFHLFFSFDYAGNGPWDKDTVKALLNAHTGSSSYFRDNGKPLVSTFGGPGNSEDWWVDITSATGCFLIPDSSSLGAKDAVQPGTAEGLFSWEGWPSGPADATTYADASYHQYLTRDTGGNGLKDNGNLEPVTGSGFTLLTVYSGSTHVHLTKQAADQVKSALSQQTCAKPGKRATHTRHKSRHNTAAGDVTKRDMATDTCMRSTVFVLLRNANLVSILTGLYRANPIPGALTKISQLPGFTTQLMDSTFINGLSSASNFLKSSFPAMTTDEMLWIYYTLMDTALFYLGKAPADFTSIAVYRINNMPDLCPNEQDTDCASALCDSKDGTFCSGFIGPKCRCQAKCKVKYSKTELMPFCTALNCQPIDPMTGVCLAAGKYNMCTCAGSPTRTKYTAHNIDLLNQIWKGPDFDGKPDAPEVKPDVTLCYKKGDSTHPGHENDPSKWNYMEQPVLAQSIDQFCEASGDVDASRGESGTTTNAMNRGTLNEVTIGFTIKQGGKQTVELCKKNLKGLSANCDWHLTENQYNWKWGGEFTTGLFSYWILPTGNRFPVRKDPDSDWWRQGDDRHYWNNGKTAGSGEKRLGKNGMPFNLVVMNQCIHHLKLLDWGQGGSKDCGGIVDISMGARILYKSHDDCFENTWRTIAWKLQNDNILCGYANHQAGASGPSGATCWAGIECW